LTVPSKAAEYTFFSTAPETCSSIDYIVNPKANQNTYKKRNGLL
jgi:hypothetical protein